MASELGVSRRWLIAFEQGEVSNPGFGTILRALSFLGLSLDVRNTVPMRAAKQIAHQDADIAERLGRHD